MRAPPADRGRPVRRRWRARPSRRGTHAAAAACCCRGRGSSSGLARDYATSVRVLLADPPAFTPWYDHELAAALGRAGADVELVTSRFRFGESPAPTGYSRSEPFYPLSSRAFRRSRLRIPVKAVEHVPGMLALLRRRPDVLHLQWLAAPELDRYLLRTSVATVFT